MKKNEKALIEAKIDLYMKWAEEEVEAYRQATDKETKDDKWMQYRLYENAADTLEQLLWHLGGI